MPGEIKKYNNAVAVLDKNTIKNTDALTVYTQRFFERQLPILDILPKGYTADGTFKTIQGPRLLEDINFGKQDYSMTETSDYPAIDEINFVEVEGSCVDKGAEFVYSTVKLELNPESIISTINFHLMSVARQLATDLYRRVSDGATEYNVPLQVDNEGNDKFFEQLPFIYMNSINMHYNKYNLPIVPNFYILSPDVYEQYTNWLVGAESGSYTYTGLNGFTAPRVVSSGIQLEDSTGPIDYIAFDTNYQFGRLMVRQFPRSPIISGMRNTVDTTITLPANARVPLAYTYSKSPDLEELVTTRIRSVLGFQALEPLCVTKGVFERVHS